MKIDVVSKTLSAFPYLYLSIEYESQLILLYSCYPLLSLEGFVKCSHFLDQPFSGLAQLFRLGVVELQGCGSLLLACPWKTVFILP